MKKPRPPRSGLVLYLFHKCQFKDAFAFKGGTSLSKAWHVIERFSEDIDLILDWRILGYAINEPWEARSNKKQVLFNKGANAQAEQFIGEKLVPLLIHDFTIESGISTESCTVSLNRS